MCPTPPTPGCWPRQSDGSRPPESGPFAAGGATRSRVRDRSRAAGKRAHAIGFKLRSRSAAGRDKALAAVRRTTFGAGRPGRDRRHRCRTAADQRAPPGTRQSHSPEDPGRARRSRRTSERTPGPRHRRPPRTWSPPPGRSPRRPDSGWPGRPRTEPPGESACTTGDVRPITKGRLGKPVDSATRPSSSKATTA